MNNDERRAPDQRTASEQSAAEGTVCKTCEGRGTVVRALPGFHSAPCPDCTDKPDQRRMEADEVERVAKAIAEAPTHSNPNGWKWTDLSEYGRDSYMRMARAAVAALSQPKAGVKP